MSGGGHWSGHARQWSLIGPPLRPCVGDVERLGALVREWAPRSATLRVLLLGVTPEIVRMPWPDGTRLCAVDRNPEMIEAVFPHEDAPPGTEVFEGDWTALPFDDGTFDVIMGDGCLSLVAFPDGYHAVLAELVRVAVPGAVLISRLFAALVSQETLAQVADDLWAGNIGNFHVLKWRIAMAIQAGNSVRLGSIHDAYRRIVPEPQRLTDELGWDAAVVGTIDVYRDSDTCYAFPTLDAVRATMSGVDALCAMTSGPLEELVCEVPTYELGERCPTLVSRIHKG